MHFLILLFLLTTPPLLASETIKIGTVEIELASENKKIVIRNSDYTYEYETDRPDSVLDYQYILTTPYIDLSGIDGIIQFEESKGLKRIPWNRQLTSEDFPLFKFYNGSPTWVGVLTGSAGSRSGQELTFFDTASTKHEQVLIFDMNGPVWISEDDHPVSFVEQPYDDEN